MALLKKAAEQGHVYAMSALGDFHNEWEENEQAVEWITKAAEAGLPTAMHELGSIHHDRNEHEQAVEWFAKGAGVGRCTLNRSNPC